MSSWSVLRSPPHDLTWISIPHQPRRVRRRPPLCFSRRDRRVRTVTLTQEAAQMTDILWSPTAARIEDSALRRYLDWLQEREGRPFPDHDAFHAWSVEDVDRFWISVVDHYGVEFS